MKEGKGLLPSHRMCLGWGVGDKYQDAGLRTGGLPRVSCRLTPMAEGPSRGSGPSEPGSLKDLPVTQTHSLKHPTAPHSPGAACTPHREAQAPSRRSQQWPSSTLACRAYRRSACSGTCSDLPKVHGDASFQDSCEDSVRGQCRSLAQPHTSSGSWRTRGQDRTNQGRAGPSRQGHGHGRGSLFGSTSWKCQPPREAAWERRLRMACPPGRDHSRAPWPTERHERCHGVQKQVPALQHAGEQKVGWPEVPHSPLCTVLMY